MISILILVPFEGEFSTTVYKNIESRRLSMAMGGGESFLLGESSLTEESKEIAIVEKSIEEQLADAEIIVAWLEEVSKEKDFFDYIDKKLWAEFVDSIYDWLGELETLYYEDKSFY